MRVLKMKGQNSRQSMLRRGCGKFDCDMASTREAIAPLDQSTPKNMSKSHENKHSICAERKSLQTIQLSALDDKALARVDGHRSNRNGKSEEKIKFKPVHGHVKVFQDSDDSQKLILKDKGILTESKETQTEDSLLEDLIQDHLKQSGKRSHSSAEAEEDEAYELMVKEPVPESYWKEIAEQRRQALNDTLEENKSLHEEMESLKEENEILTELASQNAHLSSFLQSVGSDDEAGKEVDIESEKHSREADQQAKDQENASPEFENIATCDKTDQKKETEKPTDFIENTGTNINYQSVELTEHEKSD